MGIQHKIGGCFRPPEKNYRFFLDCNYEWITFNIYADKPSWFMMLIWDSSGVLRLQYLYGKAPNTVVIHNDKNMTSAAALPGKIPAGEWRIEASGIGKDSSFNFCINIEGGFGKIKNLEQPQLIGDDLWATYEPNMELFIINNYDWDKKYNQNKGWYKGDFHTHTNISDGKLTPHELLEEAKKQNLDFFVTTEHNIIHTGFPKSNILVIPGIEITDLKGHFNAIGIKKWIDWTYDSEDGGIYTESGMNRVLSEAGTACAIRSINHPNLAPWSWEFKKTLLENIDTIEIWNDPTFPGNNFMATQQALELWDILWRDGYNIWGIGGSDAHNFPSERYEGSELPSIIGDPGTFVFSDSLCASSILKAVSMGRIYVSRGPIMEITIKVDDYVLYPGCDLTKIIGIGAKQIYYKIKVDKFYKGCTVVWIENGVIAEKQEFLESCDALRCFLWKGKTYKWLRVEIRDRNNRLLAFVNPIYKGTRNHKIVTWGQLIETSGGIKVD